MELTGNCCIMSLTVVFMIAQGSSGFSISGSNELRKNADDTLLNLITGMYSAGSYKPDEESQKRGQGWAISYGKRASPGWSITYGKRDSMDDFQQFSAKSRPRYIITKRATPFGVSGFHWNPTPNKRQQGWHIAYGKRFATPLYRR
ncbi:uncharacterized protein LOC128166449 [Crassostrea angulata]|uniref:Uncharacterized protein n=1 Tax=Magallana gigas TaxID=29159 RepID=K1P6T6_MAGGI|nr:uncharacterized protein LOC128166449 [Crassostrea angulata]|eukprot:XP_011425548.1 PREDICTED: uncharacterized protein LOC105326987 [Crassostrea gigas]